MIKRFTGYEDKQKFTKIANRPSLTKIIEENLLLILLLFVTYLFPFEKYWQIKSEQLAHFSYMTIVLLYKKTYNDY